MKELKFDLKLKSIPVTLDSKSYSLKELTGAQRDVYLSSFDLEVELVNEKPQVKTGVGFKTFSATKFLAMCLYDENGKTVPEEVLSGYPSNVISELHTAALSLSGLGKEAEDEAKND